MLELAAIATISYPHIFANEYCWARYRGSDHEEAVVIATKLGSEPTDFAWELTKREGNWCPTSLNN